MNIYEELGQMVRERGLLGDYSDLGNVNVKVDMGLGYILFNYSQDAMLENTWGKWERVCRGLIYNARGEVVANPFPKFFNLGQMGIDAEHLMKLGGNILFTEKMDGSLGVIFFDDNWQKWRIATRGSFTSDQAIKGQEILNSQIDTQYLNPFHTYLVEIIYPENTSVLRYKEDALYFLGQRINSSGRELGFLDKLNMAGLAGFKIPQFKVMPNNVDTWAQIEAYQETTENVEGYVLLIEGETENFRIKAKTKWYFKMHALVWGLNNRTIFEAYCAGTTDAILQNIPDEFIPEVEERLAILEKAYRRIDVEARSAFVEIGLLTGFDDRRAFAQHAGKHKYKSLLFMLLDDYDGSKLNKQIHKEMEKEGLNKVDA